MDEEKGENLLKKYLDADGCTLGVFKEQLVMSFRGSEIVKDKPVRRDAICTCVLPMSALKLMVENLIRIGFDYQEETKNDLGFPVIKGDDEDVCE